MAIPAAAESLINLNWLDSPELWELTSSAPLQLKKKQLQSAQSTSQDNMPVIS